VLLHAGWRAQATPGLTADEEAMQLYLTQHHCSRGVLSQFLNAESDWRWCMAGEEPCQVCQEPHSSSRPAGLVFAAAADPLAARPAATAADHLSEETALQVTGPAEVLIR